jgi:hypothetical protein
MPLQVRSIAASASIAGFFGVGLIAWMSGFVPFTCCKRALIGAAIIFAIVSMAAKAINAILTNAIIKSQMCKLEEKADADRG